MLLGLASVTCASTGRFELAAWMIMWGVLLDKLDGSSARLLKSCSKFGAEFDSFADFVAFGIAPAALYFFKIDSLALFSGVGRSLLLATSGLYVLAVAVRLARFNISEPANGHSFFYGLPTTLMGALLAGFYLTWEKYGLGIGILRLAPLVFFVAGLSMVSSIRLPKLKARKTTVANVFQFGNVLMAYILGPLMLFPEYLFALPLAYMIWGVSFCLLNPLPDEEEAEDDVIPV
jgi:CDP-diacylglycerol--serine O-phosphatidyltransferase